MNNRLNRTHQVRQRFRITKRTHNQMLNPALSPHSPSESLVADTYPSHIPVPMEAATADVNVNVQNIQKFNMHNKANEQWGPAPNYRMRRENLVEIAMRTVMLMRENQQLQHRLAALRAETKDFMQSVMNNPENQIVAQNSPPPRGDESPEVKIKPEDIDESHHIKMEN